jgi:uncharacterized protein (DUF58 family)
LGLAEAERRIATELKMSPVSTIEWPSGPTPTAVAEMLRALEFTINRRLDGQLHGQHQGITPGHGSEPGESRSYQPGDDVRRIDWNVTARTRELHVRDQIADRDLEAWLVVDVSAAMHFGTQRDDKAQIALAAAATVGFLTNRNQNRLGAVLVAGPHLRITPPRGGRDHVRAILRAVADAPESEGLGRGDMPEALRRVGALSKRRGFMCVISDFAGADWSPPLTTLAMRHDLLAIAISDPREFDVPPIGLVTFCDPSTGGTREVMITAEVQRRFADAAAAQHAEREATVRASGADWLELSTDRDWLTEIANHVRRRRLRPSLGHR